MNAKKLLFGISFYLLLPFVFADTIKFSSDRMSGSSNSDNTTTELLGNATVTTEDIKIESDSIKLFGKNFTNITASGTVKGESIKNKFTFSADVLKYNREKKISEFSGNVQFIDKANDTIITCGYALYNEKNETMIIKFDVSIERKDTKCKSIFALYNRKNEIVNLLGKPHVTNKDDTFFADRITINLKTDKIDLQGTVKGNLVEKDEKVKKDKK